MHLPERKKCFKWQCCYNFNFIGTDSGIRIFASLLMQVLVDRTLSIAKLEDFDA